MNLESGANIISLIVVIWLIFEVMVAVKYRNSSPKKVVTGMLAVALAFAIMTLVMSYLFWDWGPRKAQENVIGSPGMELAQDALGGPASALGQYLVGGSGSEAVPAVAAEAESALAAAQAQLASAQAAAQAGGGGATGYGAVPTPRVWRFPQEDGLNLMGSELTLFFADGSGISRVVAAEELPNGASACGWLLGVNGNPTQLVACGSTGAVETFSPSQVSGTEDLPRPEANVVAPVAAEDPAVAAAQAAVDAAQAEADAAAEAEAERAAAVQKGQNYISWLKNRMDEDYGWVGEEPLGAGIIPSGVGCYTSWVDNFGWGNANDYYLSCPAIGVFNFQVDREIYNAIRNLPRVDGKMVSGSCVVCTE